MPRHPGHAIRSLVARSIASESLQISLSKPSPLNLKKSTLIFPKKMGDMIVFFSVINVQVTNPYYYRATAKHTHGLTVDIYLSVCLSVRPSVRLSKACIVTKRNNHLSIFQHRTTQRCFWFLEATFRNLEFRGSPRTSVLKRGTPLSKAQI